MGVHNQCSKLLAFHLTLQAQLGRSLSRFDSSILARPPQDDDKQVVRPC
jgi:hypothetical protein